MRRHLSIILILTLFLSIDLAGGVRIHVSNPTKSNRLIEMAEVPLNEVIAKSGLQADQKFIIKDGEKEVPYQITYDGKVIFPVTLGAKQQVTFTVSEGTPAEVVTKVCGAHYPKRVDDIAWENDLSAYRVYGYKEDSASGYDIFAKRSTDMPVVPEMYRLALDPAMKKIEKQMRKVNKDSADRFKWDKMSFHVDHGYGADCYAVGPTLGAGVAALMEDGKIIYPFCYESFEILDNGPLRFTIKLKFRPFKAGGSDNIIETRIITLDLGSRLNRTDVVFENLSKSMPIVTGIVLQDKDGKAVGNAEKGFIAYPAPTMNFDKHKDVDNGTIYVGNCTPEKVSKTGFLYFSAKESKERGKSAGHILMHSTYKKGKTFTYYWGNGWNHWDIETYEEWLEYMEAFSAQKKTNLVIKLK